MIKITFLLMLSFLIPSCVKKNSCECSFGNIKSKPSVPYNSYFKARKTCKQFEHSADSSLGNGVVKCHIKLF